MTIDETDLPSNVAELIAEVAKRINRKPAELLGPRKFDELVEGRRVIARRLTALGWGRRQIGRELHKDHSTIWSLLTGAKRKAARTAAPPGVPPLPSPSP